MSEQGPCLEEALVSVELDALHGTVETAGHLQQLPCHSPLADGIDSLDALTDQQKQILCITNKVELNF